MGFSTQSPGLLRPKLRYTWGHTTGDLADYVLLLFS